MCAISLGELLRLTCLLDFDSSCGRSLLRIILTVAKFVKQLISRAYSMIRIISVPNRKHRHAQLLCHPSHQRCVTEREARLYAPIQANC